MGSQYFAGKFSQLVPAACLVDLTPPTFAGISSVGANTDGSLSCGWLSATDASTPVEYLIYIALGSVSAGALFVSGNLQKIVPSGALSTRVFMLADQTTYLLNGQTYTLGVRAKDALGNVNTNTALLTVMAVASGNLPTVLQATATALAATEVDLVADEAQLVIIIASLAAQLVVLGVDISSINQIIGQLQVLTNSMLPFAIQANVIGEVDEFEQVIGELNGPEELIGEVEDGEEQI